MIKVKFATCSECVSQGDEREKPMANASLGLCIYHNKKRLEAKRVEKYKKSPWLNVNGSKPKAQGYMKMYQEIWNERPHRSEISDTEIAEFSVWCFMHILNKNTYKRLSLDKRNVFLVLASEHHHYDNVGREDLKTDPRWQKVFTRKIELLRELYGESLEKT